MFTYMTYLVVNDTEDRGVYKFDSRSVAEDIAYNFKNYVFMHEDELDKALALAGVSEVTDAIFLIRKFRAKKTREEKAAKTETVKEKESSEKNVSEHPFVKLFNRLKDVGDTIRLTLDNGEEYVVSVKSYFIEVHKTSNMLAGGTTPVVNEQVVQNAINNHSIVCLQKTKIEYVGNYMILTGCDDKYSPNYVQLPFETYVHEYPKVAINMDHIASASIVENFNFGDNKIITSEILVKYLVRHML